MQHSPARVRLIRFVTRLHETIFRVSGGRVLGRAAGMPVVMLTTTGRRSGRKHTSMLTTPARLGDGIVLVASYGGNDRHPAWFLNLQANPRVEVALQGGARRTMTARIVAAYERERLWPAVTAAYRGYAGYQQRTTREIPLVFLDPA